MIEEVKVKFTLNGEAVEKRVKPNTTLLDMLRRDFRLVGVHKGCDKGECGACTVLMDGKPVNACLILAPSVSNHSIMTVEALGRGWPGNLHPLQEAFVQHHALQCGFCSPGMLLSAKALLDRNPHPTREDVKKAIAGNLCRCTGYSQIIDAVMVAAAKLEAAKL